MTQTATYEDVWRMFQETDRQFQETAAQMRENAAQMRETDRKVREMSEATDRKVREMSEATDRQFKATDLKIDRVSTLVGNLGGRWGDFVEGLVAPACATLFAERGIPVHKTSRNVRATLKGNRHMEIDVLVVNTDAVALVEVKSALTVEHVREHLTRLAEFKEFFPEYADKRVIGAVAGIVIEENVDRFAMNKGLFVIVQSGDSVCMANDEAFVPRTW